VRRKRIGWQKELERKKKCLNWEGKWLAVFGAKPAGNSQLRQPRLNQEHAAT